MNYKWCLPLTNKENGVDIELGCVEWFCKCGHILMDHHFYGKWPCTSTDEMIGTFCRCKSFDFGNNDKCSLECQIQYKIEEAICGGCPLIKV